MAAHDKCKCGKLKNVESATCLKCYKEAAKVAAEKNAAYKCKCGARKKPESKQCNACRQSELRAAHLESATRLAENRASDVDVLKRDLADLTGKYSQARQVIQTYQTKATVEDRLIKEVREFIESSPYRPQLTPFKPAKTVGKATEHEMLANISDAHFPEVVDPAQCFGLSYNPDVCRRRMEVLRNKIIRYGDLRRTSYPIRKLTLNVNGDMISGSIHEELEVTNAVPISESMVQMAYMLYDLGKAMRESFPEVEMIVMPGNHPRLDKKPRFKQKWNNWEWVMGMFIQALAGKDFTVTVPKALVHQFNIFDKRIGVTHGDGQKVQAYAGIPWYGMEKRRTKLQALLKQLDMKQLDLLCYGHFHQMIFEEGQGCSLFINGSIKGGDEYTTGAMYAAQSPVQGLLTFHPKHGITDISRINLGHIN